MNILIYFGNKINNNSRTEYFLNQLKLEIERKFINSNVHLVTPNNTKLNIVTNWMQLFDESSNDDADKLEKQILSADLLIIISPIFTAHISSYTKIFLDRYAHWVHTMPCIGKIGLPITISGSNSNDYGNEYLEKIMRYWGLVTMPPISIKLNGVNSAAMDSLVRYITRQIERESNNHLSLYKSINNEIFEYNKRNLMEYPDSNIEKKLFFDKYPENTKNYMDILVSKIK